LIKRCRFFFGHYGKVRIIKRELGDLGPLHGFGLSERRKAVGRRGHVQPATEARRARQHAD
jgi:hypothetical protein